MPFDAADLAVFYDPDMPGYVLASSSGGDFAALMRSADREAWDAAQIGTHTLRYLNTTQLAANDLLTIAADTYKVVGQPKRINGSEYLADLVRQ